MRYTAQLPPQLKRPGLALLLTALVAVIVATDPAAAQAAPPTGGGGGGTADFMAILNNIYTVVYATLQYAGLAILVLGAIVYFTARSNSQRAETGMKLFLGGGAMIVLYFGLGAVIAVLEWIAT